MLIQQYSNQSSISTGKSSMHKFLKFNDVFIYLERHFVFNPDNVVCILQGSIPSHKFTRSPNSSVFLVSVYAPVN